MPAHTLLQSIRRRRRPEWPWFAFDAITLGHVIAITLLASFDEAPLTRFEVEPLSAVSYAVTLRNARAWERRRAERQVLALVGCDCPSTQAVA